MKKRHNCSISQLIQTPFKEPALRLELRQFECPLIGVSCFAVATEAPVQIGPGRMSQVIFRQLATCKNGIDELQASVGAVTHRDGDSAVEFDYRRWFCHQQHIESVSRARGAIRCDTAHRRSLARCVRLTPSRAPLVGSSRSTAVGIDSRQLSPLLTLTGQRSRRRIFEVFA